MSLTVFGVFYTAPQSTLVDDVCPWSLLPEDDLQVMISRSTSVKDYARPIASP